MANFNLGQDVANKREKINIVAQILSPIASCSNASLRFSY